jgi:serine protease Do
MIGRHERQAPRVLNGLAGVTSLQASSVVEVLIKNEPVSLGTVVDSSGHIVTKASELGEAKEVVLRTSDRQMISAKVERIDARNDIALLSTSFANLTPVAWVDRQPLPGEFVVSADFDGKALAVGTYSNSPRSLENGEQAMLGVQPQNADQGITVVEVTSGGAAELAGLQVGDVVLSLDEKAIVDVAEFVNEIRKRRPGTAVQLDVLRAGQRQKLRAVLAGRNLSPERAARFKMMNRLGAIPSNRSGDFPWVFQHDSPLFPEQCGGPVLDLDGNVIGLNIARQGRIASFAIPSSQVQTILADLLRDEVAKRQ